jgi:hypothetical protein
MAPPAISGAVVFHKPTTRVGFTDQGVSGTATMTATELQRETLVEANQPSTGEAGVARIFW